MNRRDLLVIGSSAIAAGVTGQLIACAKTEPDQPKAKPPAPGGTDPADHSKHAATADGAPVNRHAAFTATLDECLNTGRVCIQHCIDLLATGDTSLADCARQVTQMMAVCEAVATLAAADSKHLKMAVELCVAHCTDCEQACRKHAGHHAECKACAEACAASIAAAKTV